MRWLIRIFAVSFIYISIPTYSAEPLILGIHPYRSHAEVKEMFSPLAEFLSRHMGKPVEVRIGESYESHINAIVQGQVDLAFIGPALYVQLTDKHGVPNLLARLEINGRSTFSGKIFTRVGSDIRFLEDLKGRSFAFGSLSSAMSHLVPRQMLFEAGVDVEDFSNCHFFDNHDNVALAVLAGDADAGAVNGAVFDKYQPKGITSIATTPEISGYLFIAPANSDPEKVRLLRRHLLSLATGGAEISQVLHPIMDLATALVNVHDNDYQELRKIIAALKKRGVVE